MQTAIIPFDELVSADVSKSIKYGDAKENKSGKGKTAFVQWRRGPTEAVRMLIQTPKMFCPFGINKYEPDDGGVPKYSISLSFKGIDENERLNGFYNFIKKLDDSNVDHCVSQQEVWWPGSGQKGKDIIEDRYTAVVKPNKNPEKYAPTLRCKLNFKGEKPDFEIYDQNKNLVDMSYVDGACSVVALLEVSNLWIADKKFGHNLRVVQMKVTKQAGLSGYSIQDHPDDVEMTDAPASDVPMDSGEPFEEEY